MKSAATSLLLVVAMLLLAGCGGDEQPTTDPLSSAVAATPDSSLGPELSPPGGMSPEPGAATDGPTATDPPTTTQTDTEWGLIWDDVPAGFPVYPGAVRSEEAGGGEPVSATFTIPGAEAVADVVPWMQAELELATYSTFALSGPLEDGGYVIDSVGDGDCRIETRIAPAGGVTIVTVRFGAECPFD
jgi:hypothetical protein